VRLKTLAALDARTHAASRAFDIRDGLLSDLGGIDNTSAAEQQLVQRAAVLAARIEDCECRWLQGETISINEHLAAVNCQRRVLETLGVHGRRAKDITPTPLVFAAAFDRQKEESAS
jgi:hypothetical protein